MSGVVLYSPEEARRNTFSVTKFHTLLGAALGQILPWNLEAET